MPADYKAIIKIIAHSVETIIMQTKTHITWMACDCSPRKLALVKMSNNVEILNVNNVEILRKH